MEFKDIIAYQNEIAFFANVATVLTFLGGCIVLGVKMVMFITPRIKSLIVLFNEKYLPFLQTIPTKIKQAVFYRWVNIKYNLLGLATRVQMTANAHGISNVTGNITIHLTPGEFIITPIDVVIKKNYKQHKFLLPNSSQQKYLSN